MKVTGWPPSGVAPSSEVSTPETVSGWPFWATVPPVYVSSVSSSVTTKFADPLDDVSCNGNVESPPKLPVSV